MKKLMPLAASITLILMASLFATAGTLAIFSDTEEIGQNIFDAGTLDLMVNGQNPCTEHFSFTNLKPGDGTTASEHSSIKYQFTVRNVGTLDGILTMKIVNVKNYENGRNEPEKLVDGTGGTPGLGNGELGQYLNLQINVPGDGGFYHGLQGCGVLGCIGGRQHSINCWEDHVITVGTLPAMANWLGGPGVLEFELPLNVGNVIQSDSVEFDIIIYLDQA